MDFESILDQISQEVLIPKSRAREIINSFLAKTEQAAWMDASFSAGGYRIRHETLDSGDKRSIIRKMKKD